MTVNHIFFIALVALALLWFGLLVQEKLELVHLGQPEIRGGQASKRWARMATRPRCPRRRRQDSRLWVRASRMACPRWARSSSANTVCSRCLSMVFGSVRSFSRTRATPVVWLPGSSLTRTCPTEFSRCRYTRRCPRPHSHSNRTCLSEHGMNGFLRLSNTHSAIALSYTPLQARLKPSALFPTFRVRDRPACRFPSRLVN